MSEGMIVITTEDKQARDKMYQELRKSDDPNERKVVKFSGAKLSGEGQRVVRYSKKGRIQFREFYVSTWLVAYPEAK